LGDAAVPAVVTVTFALVYNVKLMSAPNNKIWTVQTIEGLTSTAQGGITL
jgi:hypothetical protein